MRFHRPPFRSRDGHPPRPPEPPMNLEPMEEEEDEGAESGVKREIEYLRSLTESQTPVVVHLVNGESYRGYIEYYDKRFIRLTREGAPNLFIYKHEIKYLSEA